MDKLKSIYHQLKSYLGQFSKRPKKKGKPKLATVNKKTVNLAVLSGLAFILFVGRYSSHDFIQQGDKP